MSWQLNGRKIGLIFRPNFVHLQWYNYKWTQHKWAIHFYSCVFGQSGQSYDIAGGTVAGSRMEIQPYV